MGGRDHPSQRTLLGTFASRGLLLDLTTGWGEGASAAALQANWELAG